MHVVLLAYVVLFANSQAVMCSLLLYQPFAAKQHAMIISLDR